MPDMLVKLYNIAENHTNITKLSDNGIEIKRALSPDKHLILDYIKNTFGDGWASECDVAFSNKPISCFIAVKDKKIIGFGCYDATAPNYFGPTGVSEAFRGLGIGQELLNKCLISMKNDGYGYAIIGWVEDAIAFYQSAVGATVIEGSEPGIYSRMIEI